MCNVITLCACVWMYMCVYIYLRVYIMYMCIYVYIYIYTHKYIHFSLSIYLVVDIWIASTSWVLWIMLQWTSMCKYRFKILLWIILHIKMEVTLFSMFLESFMLISIMAVSFLYPTKSSQGCQLLPMFDNTVIFCSVDSGHHLIGGRWYFTVVLIH